MVSVDPFNFQEQKVEETFFVINDSNLQWSSKNSTLPFPSEQREVNMAAIIAVVSVSGIILVLGLIKHIIHRSNRPEGNIFNGYVVDIELVTHTDRSQDEFADTPGGQQGIATVCDTSNIYNDEPPSYDAIQMELPTYEEISSKK